MAGAAGAVGLASLVAAGLAPAAMAAGPVDINDVLRPIQEEFKLPALFAAVTKGGEVVAAGAVGERAMGSGVAVTLEDRIHIGSDGKAMTATVAGTLVDSGQLRWDSTIGEVLGEKVPGLNSELAAVTLGQLLSHSSGIPSDTAEMLDSYFNADAFDDSPTTLRLMAIDAWKDHAPVVPEGSPFQYANFGFMTAGAMMEAVTGEPWEVLVRERIYEPLGLESAGFGPTATPGLLDAAVGHSLGDDGVAVPRLWGPWADLPQIVAPAGTNHMNILDFARWADWNAGKGKRGPRLVEPATLAYIHAEKLRTPRRPNPPPGTPAEGGYAFGWSIEKLDWSDHDLLTHNGSNQFNLAKIVVDEELDLAIVVATNIGGPPAHDGVERVVAALYERFR
jgi:CubicO group peptidase (beta-lactamase class C family)